MQHFLSRFEVAVIVGALGLLVVGVSLIAVPTEAPAPVTHVQGVSRLASPSPPQQDPSPVASPPSAGVVGDLPSPSPAASPAAAATPIVLSGPGRIHLWRTGVYTITFTVAGSQPAAIWWSGVQMQDWSWQLVDGHCEMAPAQDRLAGEVIGGRAVIELDLTPMTRGQLVIQGSVSGGQPLGLAVVQVI